MHPKANLLLSQIQNPNQNKQRKSTKTTKQQRDKETKTKTKRLKDKLTKKKQQSAAIPTCEIKYKKQASFDQEEDLV